MKTKSALIGLCLVFGMVLTGAYGQKKDKQAVQGWTTSEYWSPVVCDNQMVDLLTGGSIRVHYVVHLNDKAKFYEIDQIKGEVTSETGEVFRIRETDKYFFTDHWYLVWRYNLIGDQGTHYIGTLTYSYWTGTITVGKTVCK
jgi:hypothetical protein